MAQPDDVFTLDERADAHVTRLSRAFGRDLAAVEREITRAVQGVIRQLSTRHGRLLPTPENIALALRSTIDIDQALVRARYARRVERALAHLPTMARFLDVPDGEA